MHGEPKVIETTPPSKQTCSPECALDNDPVKQSPRGVKCGLDKLGNPQPCAGVAGVCVGWIRAIHRGPAGPMRIEFRTL